MANGRPPVPTAIPRSKPNRLFVRWQAFSLGMITAFDVSLRLYDLHKNMNIWADEATSVFYALLPWQSFWHFMRQDANMLLYYLLLRGWLHFGISPMYVRGLSALFAVASVPSIYYLGVKLFGSTTGLIAAGLLCCNNYHAYYAQEARGYSLLMFLIILSTLAFTQLQSDRGRGVMAYVTASVLSVYAHVFGTIVWSAQWLAIGYQNVIAQFKKAVTAWVLFLVAIAPILALVLLGRHGQLSWIPLLTWERFIAILTLLAGGGGKLFAFLCYLLCGMAILYHVYRHEYAVLLPASLLATPIALLALAGVKKHLFHGRYLSICVPAIVILVAEGIVVAYRLVRKHGVAAWLLASVLVAIVSICWMAGSRTVVNRHIGELPPNRDAPWHDIADYIASKSQPGDALCSDLLGFLEVSYYFRLWERENGRNVGVQFCSPPELEPRDPLPALQREAARRPRIWLLMAMITPEQQGGLRSALADRFKEIEERSYPSRVLTKPDYSVTVASVKVALYARVK